MSIFARPAARWSALVLLWGFVLALLWVGLVQVFLFVMNPFCHWQPPLVSHVKVVEVDHDSQSQITDTVVVKEGDRERDLTLLKTEAAELRAGDEIWVIDNYVADGLRPNQFRLTPQRLLIEYAFLLLLPAGWALWRLRRIRIRTEATPPPPATRVFKDDFHLRAQRFAKPASGDEAPRADDQHPGKDADGHGPTSEG